jgi:hypothetical protein
MGQQRLQELTEEYGQGRVIFIEVDVRSYQQLEGDRNLFWRSALQARIDIFYCTVKEKVNTLCHVNVLRPEVTDLINISIGMTSILRYMSLTN